MRKRMSWYIPVALVNCLTFTDVWAEEYRYVGNSWSKKFHRLDCPFAEAMTISRRLDLHNLEQARGDGFAPCRYCLPRTWTRVEARFLESEKRPKTHPQAFDKKTSVQSPEANISKDTDNFRPTLSTDPGNKARALAGDWSDRK